MKYLKIKIHVFLYVHRMVNFLWFSQIFKLLPKSRSLIDLHNYGNNFENLSQFFMGFNGYIGIWNANFLRKTDTFAKWKCKMEI